MYFNAMYSFDKVEFSADAMYSFDKVEFSAAISPVLSVPKSILHYIISGEEQHLFYFFASI